MTGKRILIGRGKGYLNAASLQYRFIIFLLAVLGVYTFLLKVFQKLAEIVQLPIFLPVSLVTLFFFIGIVGTLYSHRFIGPVLRIRKTLEHMGAGDMNVTLRLRDSDDPMLQDIVTAISRLCQHNQNTHALIHETAKDLFGDIEALREDIIRGADAAELRKRIDEVRKKQDVLDKAIQAYKKV